MKIRVLAVITAVFGMLVGAPAWATPATTPSAQIAALQPTTCAEGQVDINSADAEELSEIIHIDAERSQQILDLRPFSSVEDLTRVSGIAEVRLADILDQGVACVGDVSTEEESDDADDADDDDAANGVDEDADSESIPVPTRVSTGGGATA